jgi:hypothetical protein
MMLALLSTTLLLTASAVHVEADICPSAGDIENALAPLLPVSPDHGPWGMARVSRQGKRLQIELVNRDGVLVGERTIDDSDRCAELAVQAALVIANWASDVHPEFARPAPDLPAQVGKTAAAPEPPRAAFDIAAGAGLSYADALAGGGTLATTWISRGAGLGLRISVGTETARSSELGDGKQAIWRRWTAMTEADWRSSHRTLALDAHAGLAFTLLAANGSGFLQNESLTSPSPGLGAGLRLSWWTAPRFAVWLGFEATYWLRRQFVSTSPDVPGQQIPRYSAMASIGLAVGRGAIPPLGSEGLAAQ